jgi:hypothetical protein
VLRILFFLWGQKNGASKLTIDSLEIYIYIYGRAVEDYYYYLPVDDKHFLFYGEARRSIDGLT